MLIGPVCVIVVVLVVGMAQVRSQVLSRDELTQEVRRLSAEVTMLNERYEDLRANTETGVAFHAQYSSSGVINMAPGATFVFDNVITNLRNGYNRHSGHFRAPISGTYMIAFSIMADWNNELYARLLVDGTFMAESVSHSKDAWDHATGSLVLHLSAGQAAWLTHSSAHPRSVRAKQGVWSTFSGFLIKADP